MNILKILVFNFLDQDPFLPQFHLVHLIIIKIYYVKHVR
jgi:hypothetical protein